MPDNKEESLFDTEAGNIPLPSLMSSSEDDKSEIETGSNLISQDIGKAISGDLVKSILVPEDMDIFVPNYILDFSNAKSLRLHQVRALDTLIHPDGDVAIYAKLPNGLERLGMGLSVVLDTILLTGIQSIFGSQCTVYKDVERGKPSRPLSRRNVMEIRLNL